MRGLIRQIGTLLCCTMCLLSACSKPDIQKIEDKSSAENQKEVEKVFENEGRVEKQGEIEKVIENESAVENPEEVEETFDLDAFYQSSTLQEYKDVRSLEESYSKEQAQSDNCFVIGAMVHNDYLYDEFMTHVQDGEDAFIRVVQYNAEGAVIIDDILYDSNKVYLVHDGTRDRFADVNDRSITFNRFDNIAQYNYNDRLYWIAFNGEISDVNFESTNTFIITLIN